MLIFAIVNFCLEESTKRGRFCGIIFALLFMIALIVMFTNASIQIYNLKLMAIKMMCGIFENIPAFEARTIQSNLVSSGRLNNLKIASHNILKCIPEKFSNDDVDLRKCLEERINVLSEQIGRLNDADESTTEIFEGRNIKSSEIRLLNLFAVFVTVIIAKIGT